VDSTLNYPLFHALRDTLAHGFSFKNLTQLLATQQDQSDAV